METLKIVSPITKENDQGFVIINAEDFIDGVHKLFSEDAPKPRTRKVTDGA